MTLLWLFEGEGGLVAKNFIYTKVKFGQFIRGQGGSEVRISAGNRVKNEFEKTSYPK